MSNKSPRIAARIASMTGRSLDPHYLTFFNCFNDSLFFEAHDVLEALWLREGKAAPNYAFYKGLIQLAGAFVHLQKSRLGPAVALFNLAESNLKRYPTLHASVDLSPVLELIVRWRLRIVGANFRQNPLVLGELPKLEPPVEDPKKRGAFADAIGTRGRLIS
ncbi:MAG: DUF309 domain-containing protein [Pedosphaera sp.]|nr:DUF309 domain-containing protein [Pedosphaera sp.]